MTTAYGGVPPNIEGIHGTDEIAAETWKDQVDTHDTNGRPSFFPRVHFSGSSEKPQHSYEFLSVSNLVIQTMVPLQVAFSLRFVLITSLSFAALHQALLRRSRSCYKRGTHWPIETLWSAVERTNPKFFFCGIITGCIPEEAEYSVDALRTVHLGECQYLPRSATHSSNGRIPYRGILSEGVSSAGRPLLQIISLCGSGSRRGNIFRPQLCSTQQNSNTVTGGCRHSVSAKASSVLNVCLPVRRCWLLICPSKVVLP